MAGGKKQRSRFSKILGPMHGRCMAIVCIFSGPNRSSPAVRVPAGPISIFRVTFVSLSVDFSHRSRFLRGHSVPADAAGKFTPTLSVAKLYHHASF